MPEQLQEPNYRKSIGVEACRRFMVEHPQATTDDLFDWIEANASEVYCCWTEADIDDVGIPGTEDLEPAKRQEIMELFAHRFDQSQGIGNEDLREAIGNCTDLDSVEDE